MSGTRERILARVREALAPLPERSQHPGFSPDMLGLHAGVEGQDLVRLFVERFTAVGGVALEGEEAFASWAAGALSGRGYRDPLLHDALDKVLPKGLELSGTFDRARVDEYHFGITRAELAIAQTGTLVLSDRSTPHRLAALAPWTHVAVVNRDTLVADVSAALKAMPQDPNLVWVTGPSKTADVEGILIQGVHGPGVQVAWVI
ncbi:MAG: LUD domain-containing protein [Opitutaceae bacterium]|nr:LUD domain-containing protein [Opitutaceae bacterium]